MKKNILITGASSGIGKALAKKLILEGHNVYCGARRIDNMDDIRFLGASTYRLDVRNNENVNRVINAIIKEAGHLDIVYLNAGYAIAGPVEETPVEKVHQQFDTNVYGAARVVRAVLPHMREQNNGRLIFTTSIAGRASTGMNSWYSASKHALNGMVKGLAQEVAQFNIQVATVEPGCVDTELPEMQLKDMQASNQLPAYKAAVIKNHDWLKDSYNKGSDTTSTVNTLITAGFTNKPKLSYRSTIDGKLIYFIQWLFGEKCMGNIVSYLVKRSK
ncbi:SDR family oxidoreductase [Thalassotalea atypica]|uniref:SDR family oxidoreductase n=1 Tax=Thalassotalea atypica TaxID=2054316 RepID=UPI002573791F|nr:SDR family oxidoreductase [Thalassotalea atypica]